MNRLLCLEDIDGLSEEAEFAFRELQSNGDLNSATSIKLENGQITSGQKTVRGPITSLACTIRGEIYEDNMSRVFLIAIDESTDQTKRIIEYQNKKAAGLIDYRKETEIKTFLQKFISIIQAKEVINPFAERIQLPEEAQKIRRLNDMFQSFVKMITILNQYQRKSDERKRLITQIEDVETAVAVMFESIVLKVDELDGSLRQFYEQLKSYLQIQRKYAGFSPFSFCMDNPVATFDPDGKKVYLIVEKYRIDANEKGEMISIPYTAVIDITKITAQEINGLSRDDRNLYDVYQKFKTTQFGSDEATKYENSDDNDVYLFQKAPKYNSGLGTRGGITLYDVRDKNQNNKFDLDELVDPNSSPEKGLIGRDFFDKMVDVDIQKSNAKKHIIFVNALEITPKSMPDPESKDPLDFNMNEYQRRSMEVIPHELKAHVDYSIQRIIEVKQHDIFFGKENGNRTNYASGSDYDKLKKQINEKIKQKDK